MYVYRLARARHAGLSGEGARSYGGRWNGAGAPAVYAAASRALAALEYLVHLDVEDAPDDLVLLTIALPDGLPETVVELQALAAEAPDWAVVAEHPACRRAGDAWLGAGATLALRAPAAPVPEEQNVVLNPRHPAMREVRVVARRAFTYAPRLLG